MDPLQGAGSLAVGRLDSLFTVASKPASGSRSRCGSPCSTLDGEAINVSVKNTFLDFDSPSESCPFIKVRRTRSLERFSEQTREVWICSPRQTQLSRVGSWPTEFCLDSTENANATGLSDRCTNDSPAKNDEKDADIYIQQESASACTTRLRDRCTNDSPAKNDEKDADIYIQQESASACASEDDFIAEVASYHGAAKRLGRERERQIALRGHFNEGPRRVCSWPGPNMAVDAIDGENVEFDLTIEEDEKPIKPIYSASRYPSRLVNERSQTRHYLSQTEWAEQQHPSNMQLTRVCSVPNMDAEGNYNCECQYPMRRISGSQSPKVTQFGGVEYAHNRVPKKKDLQREFERASVPMTTIMIRNIPNRYRQDELVQEININELEGTYDFVYLPMDKSTKSNVGYAFVNFIQEHFAVKAMQIFTSYRFSKYQRISRKIASASVAHIQGFDANLRHYKQSAVNDGKVTDNRPLVIAQISHRVSNVFWRT